jgi:chromate transporter
MVVQFVGFLAAYRQPDGLPPLAAGVLGSVVTVWATFVPCFLYIFVGAPYIERLRANKSLSCALSAITAAVVGVVLNLAVWFAIHVLFSQPGETRYPPLHLRWYQPDWQTISWPSVIIALAAAGVLFGTKRGIFGALAVGALGGLIWFIVRQVLSTEYLVLM